MVPTYFNFLNSLTFRLLPKIALGIGGWVWRFLRVYAGLVVDGLMKAEFACGEARSKTLMRLVCAFHAHQHASSSNLDLLFLSLTPMTSEFFLFERNHEKGRGDLNRTASEVSGNHYKKDRRWQSSWISFYCLPKLERDMILPLRTHGRNLVLRPNAQRFSWPSYTSVVRTIGYLQRKRDP